MIPVVINNRNRLTLLRELVNWLRDKSVEITILDNDSTYPPLLEYYSKSGLNVVYLRNCGNTALYTWNGHLEFPQRYFIYTDSDILPKENCPDDLIEYLLHLKQIHQEFNKIGVALEINDLPNHYLFKKDVLEWEARYWKRKVGNLYMADVDTTFAMYDKENKAGKKHCLENCLRTNRPYVARHLPWYLNLDKLNEEERYYNQSANALLPTGEPVGMWTQKHKFGNGWRLVRRDRRLKSIKLL